MSPDSKRNRRLSSSLELVEEGIVMNLPRPAPGVGTRRAHALPQYMLGWRKCMGNHMRCSRVVGEGSRASILQEGGRRGRVQQAGVPT